MTTPTNAYQYALIRILIANAFPIMRTGLIATIETEPQMQVVGAAMHRQDLQVQLRAIATDVAVINLVSQCDSPVALIRDIRWAQPQVGIVVLSTTVDCAPELLAAGVHGYTSYAESDEQLHLAIRAAKTKQRHLSPLTQEYVDQCGQLTAAHRLAPRELQIVKYITQGMRVREIASILDLTDDTVQNYVSRIRKKTGWSSRTQMVSWYHTLYGSGNTQNAPQHR